MNDSATETEQPKPEVVVKLGEEFNLFQPEHRLEQRRAPMDGRVPIYFSSVLLEISDKISVPWEIYALASRSFKNSTLTPFHPENGHIIDSGDFDPAIRDKRSYDASEIDFQLDPLFINIRSLEDDLNKYGLNIRDRLGFHFSPEMRDFLSRLRVSLSFPAGSSFESRIWPINLDIGNIRFHEYYPSDFEPLAEDSLLYKQGLSIYIPSDLSLLQQIKAKFYLEEEKDKQLEEESEQPDPYKPTESNSGGLIRSRNKR